MNRIKQKLFIILLYAAIQYRVLSRPQRWVLVWGVLLLAITVLYAAVFMDRNVTFAYSGQNCHSQLTLLPNIMRSTGSSTYTLTVKDTTTIKGYPVVGHSVCLEANKVPTPGKTSARIAPFGSVLFVKSFQIQTGAHPTVRAAALSASPLPTQKPLTIPLTKPDSLFSYSLKTADKSAPCTGKGSAIVCDVTKLRLSQGTAYKLALLRTFGGKSAVVTTSDITTLSAVNIVESSVKAGETVYARPTSITIKTDKPVKDAELLLEQVAGGTRTVVPTKTTVDGQQVTVTFAKELPRQATYELSVKHLEATDSSSLSAPYHMAFTTSGGPRPVGVSVGGHGVGQSASVVVTFDQAVAGLADASTVASVTGANAVITQAGNRMTFTLRNAPLCTALSLNIKGTLANAAGVTGVANWSHASRTQCYSVSTIGHSAKGQPIHAYIFGSGGTNILYTGAMHGDERSGGLLMDAWISELDANPAKIPTGRKLVVIPRVNPDGYASNVRYNTHKVDLNRNFPTANWKSDVTVPGGSLLKGGGGATALSEPESQALANYTVQLKPRLVMTFHAVAGVVIANEAGISDAAASTYARLSGYRKETGGSAPAIFQYDTCGAYEDWLYEKHGIATVLVEMSSRTGSQIDRNRNALWATTSL